ncbi:MAG TPA: MBG domain-containing protein, partial [Bacteroidales bacterium]|nr:MBG domain-containing protein [Bacteroidales bacterium]
MQKNLNRLTWILVLAAFGFFGSPVGAQITGTSPASRCGEGQLVLHATASSGIITWYSVPFYGTSVATGGTFTTPSLVVTTTYYVDAVDDNGCSLNPGSVRVPVIATISANSIQATIFYESSTFCASVTEPQLPTRTGTAGGTYTADPVTGLDLDPSTGAIIPSESANGTYTVTYTVIPAEGCIENPASTTVTITNAPEQPVIAYSGSPFCTTSGPVTVSLTGATGGTFSATPTGLTIHSGTGTITPSSSFTGTYTISYFVPGTGGCSPMTATTTASILQLPTASISYNSPFTKNQGVQSVTLTGSGVYTGGTYSSTAGLTLNPSTGAITPSTSTTGTYTVTYTLAAVAPCAGVTATTSVTIYPLPTATVSGTTTVCKNSTDPSVTFTGSDGTPPYTFTYNINGGTDLSVTTTSGNSVAVTQLTDIAGTYAYNLLRVTDSHGSWQDQSGTATVTVTEPNVGNFIYAATPYCSNSTDPLPQFEGSGMAGVFSSTTGLVFVSTSTGEVDLSASTAGTYTVTNTIAATGGCPLTTYTASLTITQLPVAGFTYASDTYCTNGTDPTPILGSGATAGIFTSSPAGVVFVSSSTGQIDLSASTPGSYTIYNTIDASAGCPEVSASFGLSIGAPPTEPHIAYSSASFCTTITSPQPVELTGTTGGTFTASPSGLTIHASTGAITPSTSTPNAYTVTYTVGGGSGCSALTATTEVEILEAPTVTNATTKTICSNTSTDIDLTASINSTFAWTLGLVSTSISNAEPGTGDYIDQTLINADYNNTGEAPYIITATSTENGCASNTLTITVTVRPAVALVITNPAAVCYPNTVDITAPAVTAGSASGLTFSYTDAGGSPVANPEAVAVSGYYYIRGTTAQGCYEISPASVTINPLPIAPTAENTTVTFDGNSHSASASAPSGAHVSWYDAATGGSPAAAPTATNAGTYTAYAESVDNTTGCVSATRTLVTLEIDQAMLTVTADPQTKVYGASNPTLTFQYSGWQNGDDASDLTTPPTASTTVDLTTGVGVHDDAITVSGGGDDNYDFTYVAADFTITKAMLTVTADPQTKIYGEANPTLTFQYSGWQNGDDAS